MAHRTWFSRGGFGLDFGRRNTAGTPAAQRGSEAAAITRRGRTRPVTLARSAADETPVAVPAKQPDWQHSPSPPRRAHPL